jgi:hypothetical protein
MDTHARNKVQMRYNGTNVNRYVHRSRTSLTRQTKHDENDKRCGRNLVQCGGFAILRFLYPAEKSMLQNKLKKISKISDLCIRLHLPHAGGRYFMSLNTMRLYDLLVELSDRILPGPIKIV